MNTLDELALKVAKESKLNELMWLDERIDTFADETVAVTDFAHRLVAELAKGQEPSFWYHVKPDGDYMLVDKKPSWPESVWPPLYAAPVIPAGWLRAVDEAMVSSHLGVANATDTYEEARKKLNDLICWNNQVATDPAVNGGWVMVPEQQAELLAAHKAEMHIGKEQP